MQIKTSSNELNVVGQIMNNHFLYFLLHLGFYVLLSSSFIYFFKCIYLYPRFCYLYVYINHILVSIIISLFFLSTVRILIFSSLCHNHINALPAIINYSNFFSDFVRFSCTKSSGSVRRTNIILFRKHYPVIC